MVSKVIPLDKFSEEFEKFSGEHIENYKKSVMDALMKSLIRLVKASPIDTGLFAQSWDIIETESSAMIGNYAPHAPIIEFGARPFTPPIGPLLDWAKRVLKKPEIDGDCWALATYTQQKISEKGMEPKHLLTNEMRNIIEDIKANLRNGNI